MDGPFAGSGFGPGSGFGGRGPRRGFGPGRIGGEMWDAMEHLRSAFEQRGPGRVSRGDVRQAVIALLAEQPMHGYQIITEIAQRSGGAWKPSAGSVYPTLQLLADEGLVTATESDGRKTYALTEAGRDEAAEVAGKTAPWETSGGMRRGLHESGLPKAGISLAQATAQLARSGTPEQLADATAILEDARRKIYTILARE